MFFLDVVQSDYKTENIGFQKYLMKKKIISLGVENNIFFFYSWHELFVPRYSHIDIILIRYFSIV